MCHLQSFFYKLFLSILNIFFKEKSVGIQFHTEVVRDERLFAVWKHVPKIISPECA
jgi:hypothetical protein